MKKFLLFSLLAFSGITSTQCNFFSIFGGFTPNQLVYSTQQKVYNAFIYLAGNTISQSDKKELWEESIRAHKQIQENIREIGDDYSKELIAQTILEFFLMHIKTKFEIEAHLYHLPKEIAHTFYAEQTRIIGQLSSKSEVTSVYDLPYGVFAPLFGANLENKIERLAIKYHEQKNSQTVSWTEMLIVGGLLIVQIAEAATTSYDDSRNDYPTVPTQYRREYITSNPDYIPPTQEYHHHNNPYYQENSLPIAQSIWEEGGLPKVRPDDCILNCYENFSPERHRVFCPFCGKPACVSCWQGNIKYNRYCGQGCFDSHNYSLESRTFWKNRIQEVLNNATTYCALCNKHAKGMTQLRNCGHKLCGMCQAMWNSLDGNCSEYCPRCTTPLH